MCGGVCNICVTLLSGSASSPFVRGSTRITMSGTAPGDKSGGPTSGGRITSTSLIGFSPSNVASHVIHLPLSPSCCNGFCSSNGGICC